MLIHTCLDAKAATFYSVGERERERIERETRYRDRNRNRVVRSSLRVCISFSDTLLAFSLFKTTNFPFPSPAIGRKFVPFDYLIFHSGLGKENSYFINALRCHYYTYTEQVYIQRDEEFQWVDLVFVEELAELMKIGSFPFPIWSWI